MERETFCFELVSSRSEGLGIRNIRLGTTMIFNVQYLRFFAASVVVLHHAVGEGENQFDIGAAGVGIFFVISGFIMVFITDKKERAPVDFFLHRLTRVAPPYWLVTLAMASCLLLIPHGFAKSIFSLPHVLSSLFFWPYPSPATREITPLYVPGWTLNYEFFFYSLFAVALAVNFTARALLVSAALLAIVTVGRIWPADSVAYTFFTAPIILEFVYGMMIGSVVSRDIVVSSRVSCAIIGVGLALFIVAALYFPVIRLSSERFVVWGLPAALIVAGSIFLELSTGRVVIKSLLMMGDASYAIYVTHFIVIAALNKMWRSFGLPEGSARVLTCFAVATAVGVAFHLVIERRLFRFRFFTKGKAS